MNQIEFKYKDNKTIIHCNENEKMSDIIKKYANKAQVNINKIYFSYDGKAGNLFNQELSFNQIINSTDRSRKTMTVLVNDLDEEPNENSYLIKSNDTICPKCFENSILKINNYKIALYDIKNEHKIENISLNEFELTQKIDIAKIICGKCKIRNKSNVYGKEFFKCLECNMYLCSLCKEIHEKDHSIINYDNIRYTCQRHNDTFSIYCKDCKMNICTYCKKEHKNHDLIELGDVINNNINNKELEQKLNELQIFFDKFKNEFNEIYKILNEVKITFELYYKIKEDIIKNYNNRKKTMNYL